MAGMRKEKNTMRIFCQILIISVFLSGVLAAPCFARYLSPSHFLSEADYAPTEGLSSDAREFVLLEEPDMQMNSKGHDDVLYAETDQTQWTVPGEVEEEEDFEYMEEEELDEIADPFEPLNRAAFYVNDKFYYWALKPVAKGYSHLFTEDARTAIRNVFTNLAAPVRIVNNLLQFKIKSAGNELLRFGANSTFGVLGLVDFAGKELDIKMQDEDLGQTLGVWGVGPGFYINWLFTELLWQ
jgi:hypothetical protein